MNSPRITNEERGITINKSLAWTMAVALVAGGVWVGTETQGTKQAIEQLAVTQNQQYTETLTNRREIDVRVRSLETARATQDSELTALRRDLTGFRTELREAIQLLRRIEERARQ